MAKNCENCDGAPAAFYCTADGAYLCTRCDLSIHSANKLAMRHERVAIDAKFLKVAKTCRPCDSAFEGNLAGNAQRGQEQLIHATPGTSNHQQLKGDMDWLLGEGEHMEDPLNSFLNFGEANQGNNNNGLSHPNIFGDDLFGMPTASPSGLQIANNTKVQQQQPAQRGGGNVQQQNQNGQALSGKATQVKTEQGIGQGNGSSAPGSVGGSNPPAYDPNAPPPPTVSAQRHAQLQRYRAKRLARHLGHKKIRYECRKTLADNRPRIKGRFAKVHGPNGVNAAQTNSPRTTNTATTATTDMTTHSAPTVSIVTQGSGDVDEVRSGTLNAVANGVAQGISSMWGTAPSVGGGGGNMKSVKFADPNEVFAQHAGESMADSNSLLDWSGVSGGDHMVPMHPMHHNINNRTGMSYSQSEVSLIALDPVW